MDKFCATVEDSDKKKYKRVLRRLRNARTAVRNVRRTPHFIASSMEKIIVTSQWSEKSSSKGLQKKTSLGMAGRITRRSLTNLISCRKKLPIRNISM